MTADNGTTLRSAESIAWQAARVCRPFVKLSSSCLGRYTAAVAWPTQRCPDPEITAADVLSLALRHATDISKYFAIPGQRQLRSNQHSRLGSKSVEYEGQDRNLLQTSSIPAV